MDSKTFVFSFDLPSVVFSSHFLLPLDLSSNGFSSLPSSVFTGLCSLTTLHSPFHSIIIPSFFTPFTFYLDSIRINTLPSGFFSDLHSLSTLFISSSFHPHKPSHHSPFPLIPTVFPPFLQVFLKVLTIWLISHSISLSFPPSFSSLFVLHFSITTD